MTAHPADDFTLSDLSRRLGVNLASMHAVLAVLTDSGYLIRHPRRLTYSLGNSAIALGSAALERNPVVDITREVARDIAADLGLEVAVTAVAGNEIVFLARAGEFSAHGPVVHVGQRLPLTPPLGGVFIAWQDPTEWLAAAEDPDRQLKVLESIRARGYSVALELEARRGIGTTLAHLADDPTDTDAQDVLGELVVELGHGDYQIIDALDGSATYDLSILAAPVFDAAGQVALALTLIGFPPSLDGRTIHSYGERLRAGALLATKRSGGRPA